MAALSLKSWAPSDGRIVIAFLFTGPWLLSVGPSLIQETRQGTLLSLLVPSCLCLAWSGIAELFVIDLRDACLSTFCMS